MCFTVSSSSNMHPSSLIQFFWFMFVELSSHSLRVSSAPLKTRFTPDHLIKGLLFQRITVVFFTEKKKQKNPKLFSSCSFLRNTWTWTHGDWLTSFLQSCICRWVYFWESPVELAALALIKRGARTEHGSPCLIVFMCWCYWSVTLAKTRLLCPR